MRGLRRPRVVPDVEPSARAKRLVERVYETRRTLRAFSGGPIGFKPDGEPWELPVERKVGGLRFRAKTHQAALDALIRYFVSLGMHPGTAAGEVDYLRRANDDEEIEARSKLALWRLWDWENNQCAADDVEELYDPDVPPPPF